MDTRLIILAILQEARSQGISPLLRTALIKYLYLLDVYVAEESHGVPLTDWDWKFLHFGPFSPAVARTIDDLAEREVIHAERGESREGDREFVLYDLGGKGQDLRDIGISGSIQRRIQADMKRYSRNLPKLLNYVYFRTAPMAEAQPGDVLDFSDCLKIGVEDVRPVKMRSLRSKAIKEVRIKLRELVQARKAYEVIQQGAFDDVYCSAMDLMDDNPLEIGLTGKAKLKT